MNKQLNKSQVKAQKVMLADGCPRGLFIDQETRNKTWAKYPPKPYPLFIERKEVPKEVMAFAKEEEERKQLKTKARIAKMVKKKTKTVDPKTNHWDSVHNCWVPNQIYNKEDEMRPDFQSMNGPALVQVHNEMAVEAVGLGLPFAAARRFSTRSDGLRRCEDLYKALCEAKSVEYEKAPETVPQLVTHTPKKAVKSKAKKAKKVVKPKVSKKAKIETKTDHSQIAIACGVKSHNRRLALDFLNANFGKQRPTLVIMKAVYGNEETSVNAFYTVMKALVRDITNKRAKFEIKREKDEKGISYGLYSTK